MASTSFARDIVHIVILVVLLVVLLVVVTKFKVIHPSVVPGWQGVFCTYIEQKHSVVGFVVGSDGAGNPEGLVVDLSNKRPSLRAEIVRISDATPALLSRYEVLILEKSKTAPLRFVNILEGYLDRGGSLVWTGDALSNQVLDDLDLEEARQLNASRDFWFNQTGKDYYSWFVETYQNQQGFGEFGNKFLGGFIKTERAATSTEFNPVIRGHLLLTGFNQRFALPQGTVFGVVNQNDDVDMLASIEHGQDSFPAVLEKKYVGRIIYLAFPLESFNSESFLDNLFDYLVTC
ncbi:hypothetical protein HY571_01045 [Candidatus Micrarchaeota archaeon]|nr:hypothetical protein [Candidatus Micrarchaeota archaeon]